MVNEAPYLDLSMLESHRPWYVTCFIPTSSTNLSITYTSNKTTQTQATIIGVTISKSLPERFTIKPIGNKVGPPKQFLIPCPISCHTTHSKFEILIILII